MTKRIEEPQLSLMADEYYLLLFIKRLRNADYRLAFGYYLASSFPEKMNFSRALVEGMQTTFANWILDEAVKGGAWFTKTYFIDSKFYNKKLFEISEFKPFFTCQLLYFFQDLLKINASPRNNPFVPPQREYSSGDRLVIHVFTRELIRRNRKPMINLFKSSLMQIPLNACLLEDVFLEQAIEIQALSQNEQIFLESSSDFLVKEFIEFHLTLHFYKQTQRLERLRGIGAKLCKYTKLIYEENRWSLTRPLCRIFEIILSEGLLNPYRYLDLEDQVNSLSTRELNNILLEVSGVYETFYRSLLNAMKHLQSFSFVDDNFDYAQMNLDIFQRSITSSQIAFENGLKEIQAGLKS